MVRAGPRAPRSRDVWVPAARRGRAAAGEGHARRRDCPRPLPTPGRARAHVHTCVCARDPGMARGGRGGAGNVRTWTCRVEGVQRGDTGGIAQGCVFASGEQGWPCTGCACAIVGCCCVALHAVWGCVFNVGARPALHGVCMHKVRSLACFAWGHACAK